MNRSELADILARTHSAFVPAPSVPAQTSHRSSSGHVSQPRSPPLSPRQHFQSHIRGLGHTRQVGSHADNNPARDGARYRLQRVSSLRVQPDHSQSDLLEEQHSRSPSGSDNEPDFVIEEREAWGRRSPRPSSEHLRGEDFLQSSAGDFRASVVLDPPQESTGPVPQPRKHQAQKLPLRPFEPLQNAVDVNARPKTRHGPAAARHDHFTIHEDQNDADSDTTSITGTIRPKRRSKFLEGSMNKRSVAVASSWEEDYAKSDYAGSTDTDSDATPRASRHSYVASSLDNDETTSLPTTPATAKRGFLHFRNNIASGENGTKAESPAKKKKKGLRKSISIFNFHNLGEKMRLFGGSTTDLANNADNTSTADEHVNVLNERKRKADVAYGQRGLKKQKSTFALPIGKESGPTATPVSSMRSRRSISGGNTFASNASMSRRRISSSLGNNGPSVEHLSESDLRKQPSRADLLKENQQLRQLLRESQSQHFTRSVSAHLSRNLAEHEGKPATVTTSGSKEPPLPTGKRGPKDSERQALGDLFDHNGSPQTLSPRSLHSRGQSPTKSRPVSVIVEEPEDEHADHPTRSKRSNTTVTGPQQWEWPDDVF